MNIGGRAPDFSLPDQDNAVVTLSTLLGRGPLVFFFYPKDETPGCTAEACSFRDATGDFLAAGATVFGVSSDSVASHKRFATKHNLPYRLLADEGGRLREAWGIKRAFFGLADGRVTIVLDENGVVRHSFSAMLNATAHVNEALRTVRSLVAAAAAPAR
jgi:peroxiredoxin Q/BCP